MKRTLPFLLLGCLVGELAISLVHQFIFQAPYDRLYILIPLLFMGFEWGFYEVEKYTSKMENLTKATQVHMVYKMVKLVVILTIVLVLAICMPAIGIAFFIRLAVMYLITMVIETKIAMARMLPKTTKTNEWKTSNT